MIEQTTRDLRTSRKKPKFGFKGSTIRAVKCRLPFNPTSCATCKGACINTGFYDDETRFKQYKDIFDPKYHRTLVKRFIDSGIAPEPGGVCHSYKDFLAAYKESEAKYPVIEKLGYDPESTQFLSRKLKAKARKNKLRKEEEKSAKVEWVETKFGPKEFRETIKLFNNGHDYNTLYNTDLANGRRSVSIVYNEHHTWSWIGKYTYNTHQGFMIGNKIKGFYSRYGRYRYRRDVKVHNRNIRDNRLHLMKLQLQDCVLETREPQDTDELLKALLGA